MTREEQKQEAVARMKSLGIYAPAIREFEKDDVVNRSENGGFLFWLDDEQKRIIQDFESENNAVVYHAILNHLEFGTCLSLLYVSKYEDEWEYDRQDISNMNPLVYVKNMDDETCSEFGYIAVRPRFGGLVRTA